MDMMTEVADAELLALGVEFRKAWDAERAAFALWGGETKDIAIDAAHGACAALADAINKNTPKTMDGIRVVAMVWGWMHYLSEHPGEYEGADSEFPGQRAAHGVMTFLLKDCTA
ncbi:hypothetical protein [Mesorhizobium sp. M7A.F.Ca.ET.027.03.2.1]|uniref:hypothetical protein n=1 Tax=Mesorhizobium sp. M7A.F.Ca.ET.027.03.2.1 TaxID=2496656 RepID=UPI000FCAC552|nr:hypothetical protein [Mesorhizobium sp. M7A.F.Ca.ET.027.03.2.1]RVD64719.1 hypothetical protein EN750_11430 [Mesorhizobium sp. M7A.F.Ca.ET.027.03.2.1]